MRSSAAASARKADLRVLFIFETSFRPARILPPEEDTYGVRAGFQEANQRIAGQPRRNARIMKEKRGEVKEEWESSCTQKSTRSDDRSDSPARGRAEYLNRRVTDGCGGASESDKQIPDDGVGTRVNQP